ncbi:MAG: aminodeoxychorismate/anthranilate synthase component II [Cryomorphaceae bacterium]
MQGPTRILVIDNYDSFTYNLVHILQQLDVSVEVYRNNAISLEQVGTYSHILISPGPGIPAESGIVPQVIETYIHVRSIFGVCLGMQCILTHEGVEMVNMPEVQHGAQDQLEVRSHQGLFQGLPDVIEVGRYHSWAFQPEDVPDDYTVSALSSDGYVMAIEHTTLPLCGVQFHPESVMTSHGKKMIENWLSVG